MNQILLQSTSMASACRCFTSTAGVLQNPKHVLYPSVDWSKVGAGNYAVVDPIDTHAILYLSEKGYQMQVRVSLSTDTSLVVLARPLDQPLSQADVKPTSAVEPKSQANSRNGSSSEAPESNDPFTPGKLPNSKNAWRRLLNWHICRFADLRDSGSGLGRREPLIILTAEKLLALIVLWAEDAHFRLGGHLSTPGHIRTGFETLGRRLQRRLRDNGVQFTIMYMKNMLFYLNEYLAEKEVSSINPFALNMVGVSRTKKGIPASIPPTLRQGLADRDLRIIRVLETVLRSYTAFQGTYELDGLASIRAAHPPISHEKDGINPDTLSEFRDFCEKVFWPKVVRENAGASWDSLSEPSFAYPEGATPYLPMSASPQAPVSLLGCPKEAWLWTISDGTYPCLPRRNHLRRWLEHVEEERTLTLFDKVLSQYQLPEPINPHFKEDIKAPDGYYLGRLAVLEEPAGKLRTVAMVDYWTQRALKPMHDWMMSVLKVLPSDCTFDQNAGLEGYVTWLKARDLTRSWSVDLKSATDLIPIELYRAVFESILPTVTVELWLDLLRDRGYSVPQPRVKETRKGIKIMWEEHRLTKEVTDLRFIKYLRGQPMGALTSWPSMALVHHAIVLFSAHRAKEDSVLFLGYRVLGDDNVIGQENVANSYLLTTQELQVPTSLAKTLIGKVILFASQVYLGYNNVSPMSLNEELSVASPASRLELSLRAMARGWADWKNRSVASFLRLLIGKSAYGRFLKAREIGVLGTEAQVALIYGLAVGSRALAQLSLRTSRRSPILHAFANSCSVLAGEQDPRVSRKLHGSSIPFGELERWLAISLLRAISARFEQEAASYDEAFEALLQMFGEVSSIGSFDTRAAGLRRRAILEHLAKRQVTTNPILLESLGEWPTGIPRLEEDSHWSVGMHTAIAEVVKDHFVVSHMTATAVVPKTKADFLARPGSKAVVKTVDVQVPLPDIKTWRWPRDDAVFLPHVREEIAKCNHYFRIAEDPILDAQHGGPWDKIDSILDLITKIPRIPDFRKGFASLTPNRDPLAVDLQRDIRRRTEAYTKALSLASFSLVVDLSVTGSEQPSPSSWEIMRGALADH